MRTFALATGSSGNCIYVETGDIKALIDCGLSFTKTKELLEAKNISIEEITHVFITHEHSDHVAGLKQLEKQLNADFYISQGTLDMVDISSEKFRVVKNHDILSFGNSKIFVVNKPHDSKEAISFIFQYNKKKLGVFTDLGHVPHELIMHMQSLDLIYLECNYSEAYIKENCSHMSHHYLNRLMSNVGHLGLHQTLEALEKFAKSGQIIILSHISENTITYSEAVGSVYSKLLELGIDVELEVSFQGESSELFDLNLLEKEEEILLAQEI